MRVSLSFNIYAVHSESAPVGHLSWRRCFPIYTIIIAYVQVFWPPVKWLVPSYTRALVLCYRPVCLIIGQEDLLIGIGGRRFPEMVGGGVWDLNT